MKLAASTTYSDNDLTMPTTPYSIIAANRRSVRGARDFYIYEPSNDRYSIPCEYCEIWVSNDREIALEFDLLEDIVIIYRAPKDGTQGPELIEPLENLYLEETLMKVENFFQRVSDKVVDGIRAVLEEN